MTLLSTLLVALFTMRVPLSFAMLLGALIYALVVRRINPIALPQTMQAGLDSFTLLAVPLFLLAGNLMTATSFTERLTRFVSSFVGHVSGGLGYVAIVSNFVMSGMSGSATGDAAATGSILIPTMRQAGYRAGFAAALIAAASTVGPILPPSIILLVYASLASVSVAKLFLGGIVPAAVVGACLIAYTYWFSRRHPALAVPPSTWRERATSGRQAALALLMPVIIIGGIVSGIFTPTEASAVGVAFALVIGGVVTRELRGPTLLRVLRATVSTTGVVMLLVGAANVVSWLLIADRAGDRIIQLFQPIKDQPIMVLLAINVVLLLLGTMLEPIPLMLLLVPIFLPLVKSLGVDPVHFGIIVSLNTAIGLIHPPVGAAMFITARLGGITIEEFTREIIPLLLPLLAALLLVTYVPPITLWLPSLLLK